MSIGKYKLYQSVELIIYFYTLAIIKNKKELLNMNYDILYPNYNRSIVSISSSLLNKFNIRSNYPTLKELDIYLKKIIKILYF